MYYLFIMIPNNLNSAIHLLHSCNSMFVYYRQTISYKEGLYKDSCYINHITIRGKNLIINFPEYCDIISNIVVSKPYKVIADDIILSDIIIMKRYNKVQLVVYDIDKFDDLIISFDVHLIKNKLRSLL